MAGSASAARFGDRGGGSSGFALARYNRDGSLDGSFGPGGRVVTAFTRGSAQAGDVALEPDGTTVVVGTVRYDKAMGFGPAKFAVVHYKPDGSLDRGFSHNGKLATGFGAGPGASANAVGIRGDGRIVVAGSREAHGGADFALARYRRNGSLDGSFSGDGKVTTDIGGRTPGHHFDDARAVAIQPDGRIVAAGATHSSNEDEGDFALARYRPGGSLDRSFSGDGKVIAGLGGSYQSAGAIALQPDGKVVAAGDVDEDGFALARLDADGTLDASFGSDGTVVTDFVAWGVALQPDGRIVAAGGAGSDFALARYDSDGSARRHVRVGRQGHDGIPRRRLRVRTRCGAPGRRWDRRGRDRRAGRLRHVGARPLRRRRLARPGILP